MEQLYLTTLENIINRKTLHIESRSNQSVLFSGSVAESGVAVGITGEDVSDVVLHTLRKLLPLSFAKISFKVSSVSSIQLKPALLVCSFSVLFEIKSLHQQLRGISMKDARCVSTLMAPERIGSHSTVLDTVRNNIVRFVLPKPNGTH